MRKPAERLFACMNSLVQELNPARLQLSIKEKTAKSGLFQNSISNDVFRVGAMTRLLESAPEQVSSNSIELF
jgi:hypothetical protein